jgi:hypothetical protein
VIADNLGTMQIVNGVASSNILAGIIYNNFALPIPTEKQIKTIEEKSQAVKNKHKSHK